MSEESTDKGENRQHVCAAACIDRRHYISEETSASMLRAARGAGITLLFSFGPSGTWIECPFCQPDHPMHAALLATVGVWIKVMGWDSRGSSPAETRERGRCSVCNNSILLNGDGRLRRHGRPRSCAGSQTLPRRGAR